MNIRVVEQLVQEPSCIYEGVVGQGTDENVSTGEARGVTR